MSRYQLFGHASVTTVCAIIAQVSSPFTTRGVNVNMTETIGRNHKFAECVSSPPSFPFSLPSLPFVPSLFRHIHLVEMGERVKLVNSGVREALSQMLHDFVNGLYVIGFCTFYEY